MKKAFESIPLKEIKGAHKDPRVFLSFLWPKVTLSLTKRVYSESSVRKSLNMYHQTL